MNNIKILNFIGWIHLIFALIIILFIRFTNPELTETQLFIEFLPVWLCVIPLVGLGYYWTSRKNYR